MNARRSWYVLTLAAALALGMASGCSRARNDAQVASEVKGKIDADRNVPSLQITVTSSNGIVTLSGNVGSETERQAAANDAAQVEGVKTVVNNLQVATAQAQAPTSRSRSRSLARATRARGAPAPRSTANDPERRRAALRPAAPAVTPSAPATTAMAPAPPPPSPPPPPPKPVTIPDGTVLQVRMIDTIDSASNQPGDRFRATLDAPITIDDKVIVPQGADIEGRVAELKGAGKFSGQTRDRAGADGAFRERPPLLAAHQPVLA